MLQLSYGVGSLHAVNYAVRYHAKNSKGGFMWWFRIIQHSCEGISMNMDKCVVLAKSAEEAHLKMLRIEESWESDLDGGYYYLVGIVYGPYPNSEEAQKAEPKT